MITTDHAEDVVLASCGCDACRGAVALAVDPIGARADACLRAALRGDHAAAADIRAQADAIDGLGQPEDHAADAGAALARAADAAVSAVRLASQSADAEGRPSLAREYHRRARRLRDTVMDAIDVMEGKYAQDVPE